MGSFRGTATALALLLLAACSSASEEPAPDPGADPTSATSGPAGTGTGRTTPAPAPATTAAGPPRVVATGLRSPWGLDFLPGGDALVTERDTGEVLRISGDGRVHAVGTVPGVVPGGEGGLLGIAVAPDFDASGTVFAYLTTARDNRVVRLRLTGDTLEPDVVVLDGIPRAANHNGGRLAFGPDGHLYVTTGDAQQPSDAQDPGSLAGKILRVDVDGDPPPGNPFPGSPVWSTGHRNVQGIAWDEDGRMYASELGQNAFDELNLVEPGGNYGWPEVEGAGGDGRFVDPLHQWTPDQASPSGIAVAGGAVYVAALRGESLWRVPLQGGGSVGEPERLLAGEYGRLRDVVADEAGDLWLLTTNLARGAPGPEDDRVIVVDPGSLG